MKLFAPIAKIDETEHMVFGYASTEALDHQGEIVRKEAIEAALPDYMRFANIREMHQPSAVGVAEEAALDEKGLHLAAKIVDDEAWQKVTAGVYKGFSIGGRVTARDPAAPHIITGVDLLEISLVDRPANPEAVIELYKAKREVAEIAPADDRVQQLHDLAVELGADCGGASKHALTDRLLKLLASDDRVETRLADLNKRLEALEAQPLPARALAKAQVFAKEQDGGVAAAAGETVESFIARLRGLGAEQRTLELTKLALKFPRPIER